MTSIILRVLEEVEEHITSQGDPKLETIRGRWSSDG